MLTMQNFYFLQITILLLQNAELSASTQAVHYVKPSSLISCPGQPCLTLDEYNQQTETYFTTGSTFVFLAGNHTINTTVNLTSISEITLRGERNSQVNILCSIQVFILIQNVSIMSIEGLVFLSGNTTIGTVALKIIDSNRVFIHNVTFQGSYSIRKTFTGLDITSSDTIKVTSCSFEGNTADNGGAIYVTAESNLTLNASTFIHNKATRHGGAIYARRSNLALYNNMFSGNIAVYGGAMYVTAESNLKLNRTTFIHNAASRGAIYASGSNLALSDNMFSSNTAVYNGGAMYVTAKSSVTISDNAFTHNRAIGDGGAMYSEDSIVNINFMEAQRIVVF